MKKLFLVLLLSAFTLTACDCTTTKFYPSGSNEVPTIDTAGRHNKRLKNKHLSEYITQRTALVQVDCTPKKGVVILGTRNPDKVGDGWGTGIIVRSTDGGSYLFTAAHVLEFKDRKRAKHFDCVYYIQKNEDAGTKKNRHIATIVTKSSNRDIAVLKVDANLGIDTNIELDGFTGEDIWVAGFPSQFTAPGKKLLSITKGTLATNNLPRRGNPAKYGYNYRVTAAVYFGNSGGGLWSKEGKLMGIVSSMSVGPGDVPYDGFYYVKPVKEVLELLNKKGKYNQVFGG
jgi:S1-C subfamily serine protease